MQSDVLYDVAYVAIRNLLYYMMLYRCYTQSVVLYDVVSLLYAICCTI